MTDKLLAPLCVCVRERKCVCVVLCECLTCSGRDMFVNTFFKMLLLFYSHVYVDCPKFSPDTTDILTNITCYIVKSTLIKDSTLPVRNGWFVFASSMDNTALHNGILWHVRWELMKTWQEKKYPSKIWSHPWFTMIRLFVRNISHDYSWDRNAETPK